MNPQNQPTNKEKEMHAMQIPDAVMTKLLPHFNQIRAGGFYPLTYRAKANQFARMEFNSSMQIGDEFWSVNVNPEMQVVICEVLMSEVNNNQGEK